MGPKIVLRCPKNLLSKIDWVIYISPTHDFSVRKGVLKVDRDLRLEFYMHLTRIKRVGFVDGKEMG